MLNGNRRAVVVRLKIQFFILFFLRVQVYLVLGDRLVRQMLQIGIHSENRVNQIRIKLLR